MTYTPSWVMLGVEHDDHVELFASAVLTRAELEYKTTEEIDPFAYPPRTVPGETTYTIAAEMPEMVVVRAQSWEEALGRLFGQWQPSTRQAIESRP